jgi:hypothetical protein
VGWDVAGEQGVSGKSTRIHADRGVKIEANIRTLARCALAPARSAGMAHPQFPCSFCSSARECVPLDFL